MYQKDCVRGAWKSAHLFEDHDPKLQRFLKMLDDPAQCWSELTDACRRSYPAYKARVVAPILASDDKLVHLMIIRAASEAYADEMTLLEQYIASSDPVRDEVELIAIARRRIHQLDTALKRKPNLPDEVIALLTAAGPPAKRPSGARRRRSRAV